MEKIISEKVPLGGCAFSTKYTKYDTETATKIIEYTKVCWILPKSYKSTLYRKRNGDYFLYDRYIFIKDHDCHIYPISEDAAKHFVLSHFGTTEFETIFGEVSE